MKQQLKRVSMALLMTMVCFLAFAQKTITGTVKDSQGEAVIGASILEKGTRNGGVTDFDGNFTIKVSGQNPIVVSYIGMKPQTINVGNKSQFKDTSSTAIYGSRGANGVILVTTKSGKSGKVNVNYNAYYSWKTIATC